MCWRNDSNDAISYFNIIRAGKPISQKARGEEGRPFGEYLNGSAILVSFWCIGCVFATMLHIISKEATRAGAVRARDHGPASLTMRKEAHPTGVPQPVVR